MASSTPKAGATPDALGPVRVIVPAKSRIKLSDLRTDMPVVRVLAGRDFKVKYKQSLLGPLWLIIQPLALLIAFFVASRLRHNSMLVASIRLGICITRQSKCGRRSA